MKQTLKRWTSGLLLVCMLLSMVPVDTLAVFRPRDEEPAVEIDDSYIAYEVPEEEEPYFPDDDPDLEPDEEQEVLIPEPGWELDLFDSELYGTVSGQIVDAEGNGLKRVSVSLYDMNLCEVVALCDTDDNGYWTCETVIAGNDYVIRLHCPFAVFGEEVIGFTAPHGTMTLDTIEGDVRVDPDTQVSPAEDFTYQVLNATYASITGYEGSDSVVVLPEMIDGYIVQTIGASAFSENDTLETVILSRQLESIGSSAFHGCTNLSYVGFNDTLKTIGSSAFYNCRSLVTVDLPNSAVEISNHGFYNCVNVETVSMPIGLRGVCGYAFANCTSLAELDLPDTVTSLGYRAFYNDYALDRIHIPLEWTVCLSYGSYPIHYGSIFEGCILLTEVEVPEGMTALPDYAFAYCPTLTDITLPDSLVTIGDSAFHSCTGLTEQDIPDNVTAIGERAFQDCVNLELTSLPDGLEKIHNYAFAGCSAMGQIHLPDSLTALGYRLFYQCTALEEVNIPLDWTTCLGYGSTPTHYGSIFEGCTLLTEVEVPDGITDLPAYAFAGCSTLTGITLPTSLEAIEDAAFKGCTGLTVLEIPDNVTVIGQRAFQDCTRLELVSLPDVLEEIGTCAFGGCTAIRQIHLPDSLTSLGYRLFYQCTALEEVNIPLSWTTCLGYGSTPIQYGSLFEGCTKLTEVEVPSGITDLPAYAFAGCSTLTSIALPASLESIGAGAFKDCTALTEQTIPAGVTTIGDSAFAGCTRLLTVFLSAALEELGHYAFSGCGGLESIVIPSSVERLGYQVFKNCTHLSSVTLPASWDTCLGHGNYPVKYGELFSGCTNLTTLSLPEGMTTLPTGAFSGSPALLDVVLPNSLLFIEDNAFSNCTVLQSVWIGGNVGSIADNAFRNCKELIIHGVADSCAQRYADEHGIPFTTSGMDAETIGLSGTIETENGTRVSGVSISIFDAADNKVLQRKETDANGTWHAENIPAGHDLRVRYHHAFYSFAEEAFVVASYEDVALDCIATEMLSPDTPETDAAEFTWSVLSGTYITITGYTGTADTVVIPSQIDGYTVEKISADVFKSNKVLKTVILPDTVIEIGDNVFLGCSALEYVGFGDGLQKIGASAFKNCMGLAEIQLSNNVEYVNASAFQGCTNLEEVSLPNGLKQIGNFAFAECTALTRIRIPDSVTALGYRVFYQDTALEEANVPLAWDTCLSYGSYPIHYGCIFQGCTALTEVTVPEGMTVLPAYAFSHCTTLTSMKLPDSLVTIEDTAFKGCTGLTELEIPANVTSIGQWAFQDCVNLESVSLPDGLGKIDTCAFAGCTAIREIHLPDSVTALGYRLFYQCTALEEVNIPLSWTTCLSYGSYPIHHGSIFEDCSALTEIAAPEGMTALPAYAFAGCSLLKSIALPDSLLTIGDFAFSGCSGLPGLAIPAGVTDIGHNALEYCSGLVTISLPDALNTLGNFALKNCTGLQTLAIPDGVESIGYHAFEDCTHLTSVTLPSRWDTCPGYGSYPIRYGEVFSGCSLLTTLTLPEGATVIPRFAFAGTPTLEQVTLPASLLTIEHNAFSSCGTLKNIWIGQRVASIGDNVFSGCTDLTIHGIAGSYAETYADSNGIPFIAKSIADSYSGLSGVIVDSNGAGVGNVSVSVFDLQANELVDTVHSDAQGNWNSNKVLLDKDYQIRYHSAYYRFPEQTWDVTITENAVMVPAVVAAQVLSPDTPETDAAEFTWSVLSGTYITITGYTGTADTVVIPSQIDGYTVEKISADVFKSNKVLKTVILPDTVIEIGDNVFLGCSALEYVGFGDGLQKIGASAFKNCMGLAEIQLSNNVEYVNASAFQGCTNLEEVSLPNGLKQIGNFAFAECTALTRIRIPDSVTALGYRVFYQDTALEEANVPLAWDTCLSYGSYPIHYGCIFQGCTALTEVTVPEGMTVLPAYAFSHCTTLTSMKLPDSLVTIEDTAFKGCTGLTELEIPANVTSIGQWAFQDCVNLESVSLPDGLGKIDTCAFAGCTAIREIHLPDSVTALGYRLFYQCTALEEVNIPLSWTTCLSYGSYPIHHGSIFEDCSALTEIAAPEGMTALPAYAFAGCPSLNSIILPDSLMTIGDFAFSGCSGLSELYIPSGVTDIGHNAIEYCSGLTEVSLSLSLRTVGNYVFKKCTALEEVILPDSVESIGYHAFEDCTHLSSVALPAGWKTCPGNNSSPIRYGEIFSGCVALTHITIPEGVTTIPAYAFHNNSNLISVVLPQSLQSIGNYAFYGCTSLGGVDLGAGVTSVGDYAFYNCSHLEDMIFSDNVQFIGKYAFYGCTELELVLLAPRLISLGEYAFYNTRISEVEIPAGVSTINGYTFAKCSDLKKITMRRTVTSIAGTAFKDSSNVVIYCYNSSAAHVFAVEHGIAYVLMAEPAANGSELDSNYTSFSGTTAAGTPFYTKLYVFEYGTLKKLQDVFPTCENGHLSISRDGYYTVDIPNCTLNFGNKTKLALVPESTGSNLAAIHCNGMDALANQIYIDNETTSLDIYAYSSLPENLLGSYQLMQDGSVLATSKTGKFTINPSKITYDKPLSVRVVQYGGNVLAKLKTGIVVTEENYFPDVDIKIGDKIAFSIPDSVPLIGGGDVSFDFTVLPVVFEKEGDTFRLGIGCKRDLLKQENEWFNFKKFIEKQGKDLNQGLSTLLEAQNGWASAGADGSFDMQVYGFAEGTVSNNGNWSQISGNVLINVTGKIEQEWQTMVMVVPVVLKFSAEAGVNTVVSLGFDFNNAEVFFDGELELTIPKLQASGGVGIAHVADISFYGAASNIIKFSTVTDSIVATLNGEFGVSAKALLLECEKSLLKGSWQYYHSGARTLALLDRAEALAAADLFAAENYTIDRTYVYAQSQWLEGHPSDEDELHLYAASDSSKTLQTDIYPSAAPQMIMTDSGLRMMVWTSDIKSRTTGNHTAVVYSVYDTGTGKWSEPQILEDDGTADFYPDVTTDGETVYVIWMDSKRQDFTEESNLADFAASCEVTVAAYDENSGQFTAQTLTENDTVEFRPSVAFADDRLYACWLENTENDILTLSGTNRICYAVSTGEDWSDAVEYASLATPVTNVTVGQLVGDAAIAYLVDHDDDLRTTADQELFFGKATGAPYALTDNHHQELSAQFASILGEDALVWYEDGALCYTTNGSVIRTLEAPDGALSAAFTVLSSGDQSVVLSVLSGDDHSELYWYQLDTNGLSKPVAVTSAGEYVTSFHGVYDGTTIYTAFTKADARITELSVYDPTDLCVLDITEYYDLTVEQASCQQTDVRHGATIPVALTVKNNGTANETSVQVVAKLGSKTKLNTTVDVDLPVGETATLTVQLPLDATVAPNSTYTFTVSPKSASDRRTADNQTSMVVGYTDLQLTVEQVKSGDAASVLVTVDNLSCIATKTVLRVREQNAEGKELARFYIGEIAADASEVYPLDAQMLPELASGDITLYFDAIAVEEESYLADNYGFVHLSGGAPELSVEVSVNGSIHRFNSELSGPCTIYAAVYDTTGRMLGASSMERLAAAAVTDVALTIADLPAQYTVKVFLVDGDHAPLRDPLN